MDCELVSAKHAAAILDCSEWVIRRWIEQRRLPHVKLGRLTRIRRKDLEAVARIGIPHRQLGQR
jgi:excisionase family DNA binding protein